MYSKHLEDLIEATLADGKLDPNEVDVLKKAAEKEGVDLDELQVYMNSLMQKRTEKETTKQVEESRKYDKQRKGNVCPHCGSPIPPMTKICPECGRVVNANETSGDKELFELIDKIEASIVDVKSLNVDTWLKDKATAESLIHKAEVFYGENKKVQMLVYDLKEEVKKAEAEMKKNKMKNTAGKAAGNILSYGGCLLSIILFSLGFALEARLSTSAADALAFTSIGLGVIGAFGIVMGIIKKRRK